MAQSRPRQQVEPLLSNRVQGRETLRPAAAPVPSYVPANIPKPVIQEFIDLEPLSKTVSAILGNMREAERTQERELLLGAAADPANLEALNTGKAVSKAVNQDGVPINLSPYHYPEAKRLAGKWLANKYQQEVQRRWEEFTQVEAADGAPLGGAKPVKTYQEVANEVRAEIAAGSNIYADPLSRAAFNMAMADVDAKLQVEAVVQEEKNRVKFVQDALRQDLGTTMEEIANTGWDADSRKYVQDWDYGHTTERPVVTKKQSLQTIMEAAFTTASKLASERRYDEAAAFLSEFGKVQIGGIPIEDNKAEYGGSTYQTELENQITALEMRADQEDERRIRDAENTRRAAYDDELGVWMGIVNDALREYPGGNPLNALEYNGVFDGIRSRHTPEVAEVVISQIRRELSQGYNQPRNNTADEDLSKLLVEGDTEAMKAYMETAIMPPDRRIYWAEKTQGVSQAAANLSTVPEYAATFSEMNDLLKTLGIDNLPSSVSGPILQDYVTSSADLRSEIQKLAGGSLTDEGRQSIQERLLAGKKEIVTRVKEAVAEATAKQTEAMVTISKAQSTNEDLSALFDKYADSLPWETREQLRQAKDKQQEEIQAAVTSPEAMRPLKELLDGRRAADVEAAGGTASILPQTAFDEHLFHSVYAKELAKAYRSKIFGTPKGEENALLMEAAQEALTIAAQGVPGVDTTGVARLAEGQSPQKAAEGAQKEAASVAAGDTYFNLIEGHVYDHGAFTSVFPQMAGLSKKQQSLLADYFTKTYQSGGKTRAERALTVTLGDDLKDAAEKTPAQQDEIRRKVQATYGLVVGIDPEDALNGKFTFRESLPKVNFDPSRLSMMYRAPLTIQRGEGFNSGQTREEVEQLLNTAEAWVASEMAQYEGQKFVSAGGRLHRERLRQTTENIAEARRILEGTRLPLDQEALMPHAQLRFRPGQYEEWESDGRLRRLLDVLDIKDEQEFANSMFYRTFSAPQR